MKGEAYNVALALGSNMGDRPQLLKRAIEMLSQRAGTITAVSSFIETEPVGFESKKTFLNAAVCLRCRLTLPELLKRIQRIEEELGRSKKHRFRGSYTDRPIDIDILLYGNAVYCNEKLQVPHAEMHRREFVLRPLTSIAPLALHPTLQKTIRELLSEL